jgi:hypothetical protein
MHPNDWKKLCKEYKAVTLEDDTLTVYYKNYTETIILKDEDETTTFPEWKSLIPAFRDHDRNNYVAFNCDVMRLALDTIFVSSHMTKQVELLPFEESFIIKPIDEELGCYCYVVC